MAASVCLGDVARLAGRGLAHSGAGTRAEACIITISGASGPFFPSVTPVLHDAAWTLMHTALTHTHTHTRVHPYVYDLRSGGIREHGAALAEVLEDFKAHTAWAAERGDDPPRLHFVTHGVGALVLRAAMHTLGDAWATGWGGGGVGGAAQGAPGAAGSRGAVVMIAPPNRGSAVARMMYGSALGRPVMHRVMGESVAQELGTQPGMWFDMLGSIPQSYRCLVIAGAGLLGMGNPLLQRTRNDGFVSVAETSLLLAPPRAHPTSRGSYQTEWLAREHARLRVRHGGVAAWTDSDDSAHAAFPRVSNVERMVVSAGHWSLLWAPTVLRATVEYLRNEPLSFEATRLMWQGELPAARRTDHLSHAVTHPALFRSGVWRVPGYRQAEHHGPEHDTHADDSTAAVQQLASILPRLHMRAERQRHLYS